MKILIHIAKVRAYGSGYQIMLANLGAELSRAGHEVLIEGDFEPNPQFRESLRAAGLRIVQFGFAQSSLWRCLRLVHQMNREGIEVVLSSGLGCDARLAPLRPFIKAKVVSVFQENPYTAYAERGLRGRLIAEIHVRGVSLLFDRIICISDYVRFSVTRGPFVARKKFVTIRNGVDSRDFQPRRITNKLPYWGETREHYRYVIGLVGRISSEKRPDLIFTLAKMMDKEMKGEVNILYVLVGDGALRPQLEDRIRLLTNPSRFQLVGSKNQMTDVFNHLDILVHFRRDEGFGLVLAEAMACKIPVVSVKGGGIDEVITTGITGLLVDSLKEMPGAIRKILTDRRLRKSISDTARLAALNEFSVQRQTAEYQKVFESLFR